MGLFQLLVEFLVACAQFVAGAFSVIASVPDLIASWFGRQRNKRESKGNDEKGS